MSANPPMTLHTLLGDYPNTAALKRGELASPLVRFDFVEAANPASHFKRVVRDLEFDVAELALVTYLIAKAHAKPLVLLPVVLFSRYQHPYLVYNCERGTLAPRDLEGRRVAIRSYSVTTTAWLRHILAADYGVDLGRVRWVTYEEAHVAEFRDPPNVERAPAGSNMMDMLLAGEVDAAIVGDISRLDPRLTTVIPDPQAAAHAWRERNGALQINHMVVVSGRLSREHPDAVREVYRLLCAARRAAPPDAAWDSRPCGVEANRRNLEVAIAAVHAQGLIPRRYAVEELFDDLTVTFDD